MYTFTIKVVFSTERIEDMVDAVQEFGNCLENEKGISGHNIVMYLAETTPEELERCKVSKAGEELATATQH